MIKKLVTLVITIIVLFSIASLTACGNEEDYNGTEVIVDNFSITITVDKTELIVGEQILVSVTVKNVSDKPIKIISGNCPINIWVFKKGEKPKFAWDLMRVDKELGANETLENTFEWKATRKGGYFAFASVLFSTVENWDDAPADWNGVSIESKKIKIEVK